MMRLARCPALTSSSRARQRGAALLLFLLVVVLGAASVLMVAFSRASVEQTRVAQTTRALGQASEALIGFALQHGRLPRPAISAVDGRERPSVCRSEAQCTGFLPWVTLGVSGADSWGHLLRYSVTPAFTRAPIQRNEIFASKTLQVRDANGQLHYSVGSASCGRGECSPAILLASGKEGFATSVEGIAQFAMAQGRADEAYNAQATQSFIVRQATPELAVEGGAFDDMAAYVPLSPLLTRMLLANKID